MAPIQMMRSGLAATTARAGGQNAWFVALRHPITLAWSQRYGNDRAHAWLRSQVRKGLRALVEMG